MKLETLAEGFVIRCPGIWPRAAAVGVHSIFADIRRTPSGEHLLLGMRWRIDAPGEFFVHPENHGLKDNELIWACYSFRLKVD